MIQDVAVYIIIAGAVSYAGLKLYKFFRYPSSKCAHCGKSCPYSKNK